MAQEVEVPLAVLADAANVSREGKLNLLGVFNALYAPRFPAVHPSLQLVLTLEIPWAQAGRELALEVQLRDADGKRLFGLDGRLKAQGGAPGQPLRLNHILMLNGLRFPAPGEYEFVIRAGGEVRRTLPLSVYLSRPAGEGGAGP